MATMRVAEVPKAKGPLEVVERPVPEVGPGSVRVKAAACGVCHSDAMTKEGTFPGIKYPRVPGHEVIGVIDAVGPGVASWKVGQRVGVGWYGGHCGTCDSCRRGDFITCQKGPIVPGITYDGGYADYMIAPAEALARVPDGFSAVEAAPLMDAGTTTYNALRNGGARAGDLVAVHGIGGLGHLAVQYAVKMGFRTVAIARGEEKGPLARELGAHDYIDSRETDAAKELNRMGGAKVILTTVTSGKAMGEMVGGLAVDGTLMIAGAAPDPFEVGAIALILPRRRIQGWPSGTAKDSEDALAFSLLTGVRAMTETYPLERAAEAYDRMMSGQARFRVVLTMGK